MSEDVKRGETRRTEEAETRLEEKDLEEAAGGFPIRVPRDPPPVKREPSGF